MTDPEATQIVAEAMGAREMEFEQHEDGHTFTLKWPHKRTRVEFLPTSDANDEQLVREWVRENLTIQEQIRASNYAATERAKRVNDMAKKHDKLVAAEMMSETGDLTHGVAQVLEERNKG